jgi:sugar phosphate isomerase/epimerase
MERTMIHPSRRTMLQLLGAAGALAPLAGCATAAASPEPFFASHDAPIGIQLYTLGDLLAKDLDGSLKELARIGYKTVEIPSYVGRTPQQLRAAFDAAGLSCTSAHVGLRPGTEQEPGLLGDLDKLAADMHVIGATHVIAPALSAPTDLVLKEIPNEGYKRMARMTAAMSLDHWKQLATQLNTIGAAMKKHGLGFGYHNHNIEFVPIAGGTAWDVMIAETDPDLVSFQLDIGWAAAAGLDPVKMFEKNPGRYGLVHMKDVKATTESNLELRMDPTEVGSGRLDWAKILPAAWKAGVRKYFVEQEAPFELPRLEAAAKSYSFLSTLKA